MPIDSEHVWLKLGSNDPAARLAKAKALMDSGALSVGEYDEKKRELLGQL